MKKALLFFASLVGFTSQAQVSCDGGRYASNIFNQVDVTSNVVYGSNTSFSNANTTLYFDFYEGQGDTETARPLIIWVHGGSFIGGSRTDIDVKTLSERFAKKGYACASISYRLGFFPFDSANAVRAVVRATQDLKAAIRYFYKDRANDNVYKIDTNNIFIGGSSAGAITALHVAYLDKECEISDYLNATVINQLGGLDGNSGNPGYSTRVKGVLNGCGALARYSWLDAGEVPVASVHGTNDGTVKYNRGVVNPGTPLMFLDGSRMIHERACAVGVDNQFYTFPNAPHVPYAGTSAAALAYMDTTERFYRDFLVKQLGCDLPLLQPENDRMEGVTLYAINYCDNTPVNEVCPLSVGIFEEVAQSLNVYPNPTNDQITVSFDGANLVALEIVDLTGRIVKSISNFSSGSVISIHDLKNGNYLLNVKTPHLQTIKTQSIIKL
jgi:acetyl esterase/lipase